MLSDVASQPTPPSPQFYTQQVTAGATYWMQLSSQLVRYSGILASSVTNPKLKA